jgi:uncharacterized membrane protein YcaP (DUF421 family)
MTGPDISVGGGVILIAALVAMNAIVGQLDRLPRIHRLFTPAPAVIIKDGQLLTSVMNREGVTKDECEMAIREHGIDNIKDVQLGVLEADGTISVVPTGSVVHKGKRRVRFLRRG